MSFTVLFVKFSTCLRFSYDYSTTLFSNITNTEQIPIISTQFSTFFPLGHFYAYFLELFFYFFFCTVSICRETEVILQLITNVLVTQNKIVSLWFLPFFYLFFSYSMWRIMLKLIRNYCFLFFGYSNSSL